MNRLVLIGNGFDLAHGMKTSYNDFLLWYLKRCFKAADWNIHYKDPLIQITLPHQNTQSSMPSGWCNTDEFFDELYQNSDLYDFLVNAQLDQQYYRKYFYYYKVTLHSAFFKNLLEKCTNATWVAIENEFYEELKRCLALEDGDQQQASLDELNVCLNHLISQLEVYLNSLPVENPIPEYTEILSAPIRPEEIFQTKVSEEEHGVNTLLLNFNYTATAENYIKAKYSTHTGQHYIVNYIHGKAGDKNNPMIFGFGDELDEDYAKMEKAKAKGFLKHIKSFGYFRTQNYHKLIRFLQSDEFQVFIIGHSCGLADRTMLNMIFEHSNCKSIKIFYHGNKVDNNFISLTEEISRHFKNKSSMREKIISLEASTRMPQFNDMDE